jgi:hypothetical protein
VNNACGMHRDMRNSYKILTGKPEEMGPLRKYRYSWEDNIKIDFKDMKFEGMGLVHLAQDRIQ